MGYEIHITRAKSWLENAGMEISAEEWMKIVEEDAELHLAGFNGPNFVLWKVQPQNWDASSKWLDWRRGNIYSKHPSEALLSKMLGIASKLNARVQGDDLEIYRSGNYNDCYWEEEHKPAPAYQPRRFEWAYYIPPTGISGEWWEPYSMVFYQFRRNVKRWITGE